MKEIGEFSLMAEETTPKDGMFKEGLYARGTNMLLQRSERQYDVKYRVCNRNQQD